MDSLKYRIVNLVHRYLLGVITDEEMKSLQDWIELSPVNRRIFERMCKGKNLIADYEDYKTIDYQIAYRRCNKQLTRRKRHSLKWMRYVAVILLCLGVLLFVTQRADNSGNLDITIAETIQPGESKAVLYMDDGTAVYLQADGQHDIFVGSGINARKSDGRIEYPSSEKDSVIIQYNTLQTPRGGEYEVTLSDGTKVRLNSATQLKFPVVFSKNERIVFLSGEAFFEVEKDSLRPFRVVADGLEIQVYGTSFNVNTLDENCVQTVLVEGKIGLRASEKSIYKMKPSQLGVFYKDKGEIEISDVDVTPYIAWKNGLFVFENRTLEQLMNTLSRWYDVDIFYINSELKDLHFTGYLRRYEDINKILRPIATSIGVKFSIQGRTICISR